MRVEKKRLTTRQQPNHSKNFRVRLRKIALMPDHSDQVIFHCNTLIWRHGWLPALTRLPARMFETPYPQAWRHIPYLHLRFWAVIHMAPYKHKGRSGISASPEKPGHSDRIHVGFYFSSGFRGPLTFISNSSIFLRISLISSRSSVICFFESPSMSL